MNISHLHSFQCFELPNISKWGSLDWSKFGHEREGILSPFVAYNQRFMEHLSTGRNGLFRQ
jgi:hypothetical protein